jgi:uncharacterized protein (UPF0333 family)
MDQEGQISIEFVLLIAFMLMLVLMVAPFVSQSLENNVIVSAARSGATNATTNVVLLNRSMAPVAVEDIKIQNITNNITNGSGSQNLTIQINISGTISSDQNSTIVNSTLNSIAAQGYTRVNSTNNTPYADYIVAKWHNYYVTLV